MPRPGQGEQEGLTLSEEALERRWVRSLAVPRRTLLSY